VIRRRRLSCSRCRRSLVWGGTVPPRSGAQSRRLYLQRHRIAIRCLDCWEIFCPACARKHFAPMIRAQRAMDAVLQKIATDAMKMVERRTVGLMCAAVRPGKRSA